MSTQHDYINYSVKMKILYEFINKCDANLLESQYCMDISINIY